MFMILFGLHLNSLILHAIIVITEHGILMVANEHETCICLPVMTFIVCNINYGNMEYLFN